MDRRRRRLSDRPRGGAGPGEEFGDVYIFFIAGANERTLLKAASRVATRKGVPAGAFAMVTTTDAAEYGLGRRVALPVR